MGKEVLKGDVQINDWLRIVIASSMHGMHEYPAVRFIQIYPNNAFLEICSNVSTYGTISRSTTVVILEKVIP